MLKFKILLLGLLSLGMACTRVGPGYVGIKVNMTGSDRGVEDFPAQTGWVFYNPFATDVLVYPTFMQPVVWTKSTDEGNPVNEEVSFGTKEGLVMTADVSLSYQLMAEKVPRFYVKFRNDDLRRFTHGYLRNLTRDKFNDVAATYGVEDIYGPKKEVFLTEVKRRINAVLEPVGAKVDDQFGFVGAPRPPAEIIGAINAKIAATQKAIQIENELRTSQAEAKKLEAKANGEAAARIAAARGEAAYAVALAEGEATATMARAEAAAKANDLVSRSITPAVLEWRRTELQLKWIEKWNGARPSVESGDNGLLLQLPVK